MHRKNVTVSTASSKSFSSLLSEQWSRHSKIFKKKKYIYQMEGLLNDQDEKRKLYVHRKCICDEVRNISSIELHNLLLENSSTICSKNTDNEDDSGGYWQPCSHIVDYSRVVIQRCQNKGCMCKPIINGRPKCQVDDVVQTTFGSQVGPIKVISAEAQTAEHKKAEVQTSEYNKLEKSHAEPRAAHVSQSETPEPSKTPITESVITQNIKPQITESETTDNGKTQIKNEEPPSQSIKQIQTEGNGAKGVNGKSKNKESKPIIYSKCCKANVCDPCPSKMKFCVPSNFEEILKESGDKEIKFLHCKNRDRCTCDTYDAQEGLKKGLKLPGMNICKQSSEAQIIMPKEAVVNVVKKEEPKEELKKEEPKEELKKEQPKQTKPPPSKKTCCSCFKKKTPKTGCEKNIQTCNECCSNKICQKGESNDCICAGGDSIEEKIKSIWICSRCGKIYNNTCKRCDKPSCTRNTIIVPTGNAALSNDQTETLRTLIKLEAKQNYRQIDNIIQELNEQKNEIKRLTDMYHSFNNEAKPKHTVRMKEDEHTKLQDTQNVYICEGCEIDINRNIMKSIKTRVDRTQSSDTEDIVLEDWNNNQAYDDYKYLKNIINKRKRTAAKVEKESKTTNLNDEVIQTKVDVTDLKDNGEKEYETKSTFTTSVNNITHQAEHDDKINVKLRTEKPDPIVTEKTEAKTTNVDEELNDDKVSETRSNECSFIRWCKKSITNLKYTQSKDFKGQYQHLKTKLNECKKSLTDMNTKSKDELKCDYEYVQDKMNACKKSVASIKQKCNDVQNPQKCTYKYFQNKITQCREKSKVKAKKSFISTCASYCKQYLDFR